MSENGMGKCETNSRNVGICLTVKQGDINNAPVEARDVVIDWKALGRRKVMEKSFLVLTATPAIQTASLQPH